MKEYESPAGGECRYFGSGVIEIDGDIHKKFRHELKDAKRDKRLAKVGLWVEHVLNEDVESVMAVLEKHRRQRDDYS